MDNKNAQVDDELVKQQRETKMTIEKANARKAEAEARKAEADATKAEFEAKNAKKSVGGRIFDGTIKVLSVVLPVAGTIFGVVLVNRGSNDEIMRMNGRRENVEKSIINKTIDKMLGKF